MRKHIKGDLKCFVHNFGTDSLNEFNEHRKKEGCINKFEFRQPYGIAWDRIARDGKKSPYSEAIFVLLVGVW